MEPEKIAQYAKILPGFGMTPKQYAWATWGNYLVYYICFIAVLEVADACWRGWAKALDGDWFMATVIVVLVVEIHRLRSVKKLIGYGFWRDYQAGRIKTLDIKQYVDGSSESTIQYKGVGDE